MPYTRLVKENKKLIDKMFGIVHENELSFSEQEIENYFKTHTVESVKQEMDELKAHSDALYDHPEAYFEELVKNNDREARNLSREIYDQQVQINNLSDAENKAEKDYIASNTEWESAKKAYKLAKVKHDKEVAKLKDAYEKSQNKTIEKGKKEDVKALVELSKKNTEDAMKRAELEVAKNEIANISTYLSDLYTSMAKRQAKGEDVSQYEDEIAKCNEKLTKANKKLVSAAKNSEKAEDKKDKSQAKQNAVEDKYGTKLLNAKAEYERKIKALDDELDAKSDAEFRASQKFNNAYTVKKNAELARVNAEKAMGNLVARKNRFATDKAEALKAENAALQAKLDKHAAISDALANHEPRATAENVAKGLTLVKKVYDTYHAKYSGWARFWGYLHMGKAASDRALYSETRDLYLNHAGVTKDEVNEYLDHGTLTGSLAQKCNGQEAILTAPSYPAVGANLDKLGSDADYLAQVTQKFDTLLPMNQTVTITQENSNYFVEKGLHFLNVLGDQKRLNPDLNMDGVIQHCTQIISNYSLPTRRRDIIQAEIKNALLPEAERKVIAYPDKLVTGKEIRNYEDSKKLFAEELEKENNMVLGNELPKQEEVKQQVVINLQHVDDNPDNIENHVVIPDRNLVMAAAK